MERSRELNYWPGFVDVLSNLVLTLVFLLIIFVVAMFAYAGKVVDLRAETLINKALAEKATKDSKVLGEKVVEQGIIVSKAMARKSLEFEALTEEIRSLRETQRSKQTEINRLKDSLREIQGGAGNQKVWPLVTDAQPEYERKPSSVTSSQGDEPRTVIKAEQHESRKDLTIGTEKNGVVTILFRSGTVGIDKRALAELGQALAATQRKPVSEAAYVIRAQLGSETFSEARRSAYFRLMAVRNALIDKGVSPKRIEMHLDEQAKARPAGESLVTIQFK